MPANTAAVLCLAGRSSRMGRFKPLLPIGDSSAAERMVDCFLAAGVDHLVLVTGREAEALQRALSGRGLRFVHNPDYADTDMFASVRLGLLRAVACAQRFFVSPGDIPLLEPATLRAMLGALSPSETEVCMPTFAGQPGHPVLLSRAAAHHVLNDNGGQGLRGALCGLADRTLWLETDDFGTLFDMDRPDDYALIRQLAALRAQPDVLQSRLPAAKLAARLAAMLAQAGHAADPRAAVAACLLDECPPESPRPDGLPAPSELCFLARHYGLDGCPAPLDLQLQRALAATADPDAAARLCARFAHAKALERHIEALTGHARDGLFMDNSDGHSGADSLPLPLKNSKHIEGFF
ncbi:MAG: nucleotidyltransferase family protein [Clostridiales bacterium]|nr:nucleotidyltransferase family protein [Clostridiales bacterium]